MTPERVQRAMIDFKKWKDDNDKSYRLRRHGINATEDESVECTFLEGSARIRASAFLQDYGEEIIQILETKLE